MRVSFESDLVKNLRTLQPVCVIGIGSPHGDDRAGWVAIDQLAKIVSKTIVLRKASVPHDALNWFERNTQTHLIDASLDGVLAVRQFAVTQDESGRICLALVSENVPGNNALALDSLSSHSSHQLGLSATLELVAALGRLPERLSLWTISITSAEQNGKLGAATRKQIVECVTAIASLLERLEHSQDAELGLPSSPGIASARQA